MSNQKSHLLAKLGTTVRWVAPCQVHPHIVCDFVTEMALWSLKWRSGAPPSAPPTSPRLLGTRFSPIAWELGLQEVADASTWEWQTASAVAASLIVLCTCLLLAAWAAMQCLARLLSRVAKAADDDAAAAEAVLLPPSHPRSQEDSGSDIECHSMPVGICEASNGKLPTSGALTTASIDARPVPLLPRNIQLPAPHCATPHCTTSGPTPLASVPAAPSLPATPAAARRSGEPTRSPPSRKYLEAYCRAQSLTRPPLEAAASHNGAHNSASNHGAHNSASHNGAGAGSVGDPFRAPVFRQDPFGAPVFRQDPFGAPAFAPSGSNREPLFAPSRALGLPLVPPLLPRRLLPAPPPEAPPEAAAPYGASPQSGLSELPEFSRELSRELSGASPVSPRPYSPGGTATAGYSPPTFLGRTVGMHEGQDAVAGAFLPQIEFELSRLAREAVERVAPAVRVAKEEIAKHFEDIEEAAAAEAMAKEAVAEAVAEAAAEAAAEMAAEMAEVAVTQAVSRAAAAKAAAAEVAAAEKTAAEAAAHAEMEKAAAANRAAEKAAPAQAQRVAAEKAAAERRAKARSASAADEQTSRLPTARGSRSAPTARRASAAKAREKATAQPVAVAVSSPVCRAAAQQVLLAVRKRSLAAFDEIDLATLDLAIEQLQLDLATISQPQLDLATISWSEKSSPSRAQHGACACAPGSKESSSAKLSTVGSDWKC